MAQRSTKSNRSKQTVSRKKKPENSAFSVFFRSKGGRFLKILLIASIVLLLDLLISQNDFSLFFLLLGIELLVGFAVLLFYLAWQQQNVDRKSSAK